MKIINKYREALFFIIIWIFLLILYLPAYKAGFYADFHGSLEFYQSKGFWNFINRTGNLNESLYQVTQILLYGLISIFGHRPIPWFLLFISIHVFDGYLIYRFFKSLLKIMGWEASKKIVFGGVALFLLSPLASEVIVWKATFHYLVCVGIIFVILNLTLAYCKKTKWKYLWGIYLLYFLSSYMLELFYLTPLFVLLVLGSLIASKKIHFSVFFKAMIRIFIPLVLIWCAHISVYYFVYDKWIAHYDIHLNSAFEVKNITTQLSKFILHIFCFESFLPFAFRQRVLQFAELPLVNWIIGILLFGSVLLGILKFRLMNNRWRIIFLLFLLSLSSCILYIPMWFNNVTRISNDRYFYLPNAFFYLLASAFLFYGKKNNWFKNIGAIVYLTGCVIATRYNVLTFRNAAKIHFGLMRNFKWQHTDTVVLLNLPNNYDGVAIFPTAKIECFNPHLKVFGYDTIRGKVFDVSSYNLHHKSDGVHVVVHDSLHLTVTPNQYGCWWWFSTVGASSYENKFYKFELTNNGFSYNLTFKHPIGKGTVILFQQGSHWHEVDMGLFNEQQW